MSTTASSSSTASASSTSPDLAANHPGKTRCTNCKCWRLPADYVGKRGDIVRRCTKCRDKDSRQKKKPDVRKKRNERQNEKKYYVEHRKKKREEDEEGFLRRNADTMKAYRGKNVRHRVIYTERNARNRGYTWSEDMTVEHCSELMMSPCFYCDHDPDATALNGIDRMDNTVGYEVSNSVGCCGTCNRIKLCLDPLTFVERCIHIASCHGHHENGSKYPEAWEDRVPGSYATYKCSAKQRELTFEMSEDRYAELTGSPCTYCQRPITETNRSGIDRIDNAEGYVEPNMQPCCTECNRMRKSLSMPDFLDTCARVATKYTPDGALSTLPDDIPRCREAVTKRVASASIDDRAARTTLEDSCSQSTATS